MLDNFQRNFRRFARRRWLAWRQRFLLQWQREGERIALRQKKWQAAEGTDGSLYDWAFAQRGHGIIVTRGNGETLVLEFNEFLRRIGSGWVQAEDTVVSSVFTNGRPRRAGDLRLWTLIHSGIVHPEMRPCRSRTGVLAIGAQARRVQAAVEDQYMLGE